MSLEDIENKRKRLIFRSWHRGTREMDLIMGTFADEQLSGFDDAELDLYDDVLQHSDPDLYNWLTGRKEVPSNYMNPILDKLLKHHVASSLIAKTQQ